MRPHGSPRTYCKGEQRSGESRYTEDSAEECVTTRWQQASTGTRHWRASSPCLCISLVVASATSLTSCTMP
jgi:hypothetical protein